MRVDMPTEWQAAEGTERNIYARLPPRVASVSTHPAGYSSGWGTTRYREGSSLTHHRFSLIVAV
jgi:hypothetical protein